jgi:uncharacterized protein
MFQCNRHILLAVLVIVAAAMTTGCQTYSHKNRVIVYWRAGDVPAASAEAAKRVEKSGPDGRDAVIWQLEEGATLRALGKYQESNATFDRAQDRMDEFAQKAKVRIGQETAALLSNQANLPYEGRAYDGIMLNTYRALNFLALGEPENARPALLRAYRWQQDAVADNARRIENAKKEAANSKDSQYIDRAQEDPALQGQIQESLAGIKGLDAYADYVNPFTVYLDGLFFMADATGYSDLERAHTSFQRVAGFNGMDEYLQRSLSLLDERMNNKPLSPTTWVIFETGCAPMRDQIRIDIPIIITSVSYIGAAFPTLALQGNFQPSLNVVANGTNYLTHGVASMDAIVAQDFKNELPIIITKTIASSVAKGVAAYVANRAANTQSDWLGLLTQIGTAAYQASVNIADTRTWTTLPKEFQICCFPTPPDGKIEVMTPTGARVTVSLLPANQAKSGASANGLNVVYVKSIAVGTPLMISQFILQ